ncbi:MAG TPA: glycosyltransferase [Clostridia bacterium]|nr:glycosyltransferase [Clostridia bacterium]
MNIRPKVSIIVPVYKVEKYLRRAMDSLVNQTLDNIEIICINDGSPDNCLEILHEYKNKYNDKNIIIIDKKNEGVWKGRFDGIKIANGEYIGFTDSDDYISIDYAEKLYTSAKTNNSDISICGFYRVDTDTEKVFSTEMKKYNGKIIDMDINPEDTLAINGALWNKLYKAEILKNLDNLKNPPKILDDMMFFLLVLLKTKKISFINDPLYYYMVRSDSIVSTIKSEQISSTQNAMLEVKKLYDESENGKKLKTLLDSMVFLHFGLSLMFRVSYDKSSDFKKILNENTQFLNQYFETWRQSKYLNICYSIKHRFMNIKLAIMKKIYIFNLYKMFLKVYRFMIDKMKIDIKW